MTRKKIHLIFKTHLDIGFTDYAAKVRRRYHEHFLPMAIETGEHLWRENPEAPLFIWTTGAWLLHEHLETGTTAQRRNLEAAIEKGIVAWHALPFTTHSELLSADLFRAGLGYSRDLDSWFGRHTIGAKMTDVPGHTLGIVPLLAEAGVRFLHIGVNSASTPPAVPPAFRWRAASGEEIVVVYQNEYGATLFPDGMHEGIGFAHTMDNMGPQGISQVIESHRAMAQHNPGTQIQASTLCEFGKSAWEHREKLPVIEDEIADSWIHGVGTAPAKVARFMALRRLYTKWAVDGLTPQREQMGRRLTMVAEHTWGVDIKTFLRDENAWDRTAFEAARISDSRFSLTEDSWQEQDAYIDEAIKSLAPEDQSIAFKSCTPLAMIPTNTEPTKQASVIVDDGELMFDEESGGLRYIRFPDGVSLRAASGDFATLSYESYNAEDIQAFQKSYLTHRYDWAVLDHGKPGLENASTACSGLFHPEWLGVSRDEGGQVVTLFRFAAQATGELGAPAILETRYQFVAPDTLRVTVCLFDKPANRMPEASFVRFSPDIDADSWCFQKTGYSVDPRAVVSDGNRQLHAVEAVQATTQDGLMLTITPLDCPLAGPAETPFLPFYRGAVAMTQGVRFNLHNNKWGTNFPMWCVGDLVFRFDVRFSATDRLKVDN